MQIEKLFMYVTIVFFVCSIFIMSFVLFYVGPIYMFHSCFVTAVYMLEGLIVKQYLYAE